MSRLFSYRPYSLPQSKQPSAAGEDVKGMTGTIWERLLKWWLNRLNLKGVKACECRV